MTIEKARFRVPIMPPCELLLNVKVEKIKGKIWKYSGQAIVDGKTNVRCSQWMATIADRKNDNIIILNVSPIAKIGKNVEIGT